MKNKEESEYIMPKISIIVPVYNVEKYLRRCLDSIRAQTFTDWECICVDDGSPDGSGAILDGYAAEDGRFVVVHKENGGVSSARNAGLDAAHGEWITFVDADDWVESSLYETTLRLAKENDADLVQWNAEQFSDVKIVRKGKDKTEGMFNFILDHTYFSPSMCDKVFKKTLSQGLRFPEGIALSEDRLFALQVYLACKNCFYINKIFYHYYVRGNSASHSINKNMIFQAEKIIVRMEQICKEILVKSDSSALEHFIYEQKKDCKNQILFMLDKFDGNLFRNVFPEINRKLLKEKSKVALVYFLLFFRMDIFARLILFIHKKIKEYKQGKVSV